MYYLLTFVGYVENIEHGRAFTAKVCFRIFYFLIYLHLLVLYIGGEGAMIHTTA